MASNPMAFTGLYSSFLLLNALSHESHGARSEPIKAGRRVSFPDSPSPKEHHNISLSGVIQSTTVPYKSNPTKNLVLYLFKYCMIV